MMSGPASKGGLAGEFEEADLILKKNADDTFKNDARLLKEKNSILSITTEVINGSPKNAILNEEYIYTAKVGILFSSLFRGIIV
ncbi:MAG TPA: hypothetical protein VFD29_07295 [Gillisia sp.]|nr:hypothetical protein [Gillisia sp.]